jgi:hypothetical protein
MCELLLADLAMENGADFQYVFNNDFGNVTIFSDSQDYWTASNNTNKFRSFNTPEAGMANYVHEIVRRKTVKTAAMNGDVNEFAVQLRDTKYCPDCDPAVIGPTFSKFIKTYQDSNLFANLPVAPPKTGHLLTYAILGMTGYIFYRTIHLKPGRKRVLA